MKKTILLLAALVMTSCSGTYDLVYNQPVETLSTNIVYRTGIYGFGYYDSFGRFYGPSNILYYGPSFTIVPRRTAVAPKNNRRNNPRVAPRQNAPKPRGRRGGGTSPGRKAQ